MDMMHPSEMVSRLDPVFLDSAAAGIDFRRLPQGFWNIGVFIEQRDGSGAPEVGTMLPSEHPQAQPWPIRCLMVHKKSP